MTVTSLAFHDCRRHQRVPIHKWARMRVGDHELPCLIADISVGGMRLEEVLLAVGEDVEVHVTLPDGNGGERAVVIEGWVRWTSGLSAGVQFRDESALAA